MAVVGAEGTDQRINLVRILQIEGRMSGQALDPRQRSGQTAAGLNRQPFIDDQRFVLPALVERGERGIAFFA